MILTEDMYVPAMRWRQAEYMALSRLPELEKRRVAPIIVAPPVEYDPESKRPKKNAQEVARDFVKRVPNKWGERFAWIDFDPTLVSEHMDGKSSLISHVFNQLRERKMQCTPVAWFGSPPETLTTLQQVIAVDGHGVAIRLTIENLMDPSFNRKLQAIIRRLQVDNNDVDLILELGKEFEPYKVFARALISKFLHIEELKYYRNFIIIGTSTPESLSEINRPGDIIPRHEWRFYLELLSLLPKDMRRPNFGDYTIVPPSFAMNFNMAVIKPAARLVYTSGDNTVIRKGSAFRDNPDQMIEICSSIVNSKSFRDRGFSYGDEQIYQCANNLRANMSNLGGWKQFGINHHIAHVLDDLATLAAAP